VLALALKIPEVVGIAARGAELLGEVTVDGVVERGELVARDDVGLAGRLADARDEGGDGEALLGPADVVRAGPGGRIRARLGITLWAPRGGGDLVRPALWVGPGGDRRAWAILDGRRGRRGGGRSLAGGLPLARARAWVDYAGWSV
jgi:hypothetical protein